MMSSSSRLGRIRALGIAVVITGVLLVPEVSWPIIAATPSRSVLIRLRGSGDNLLRSLKSKAVIAGFACVDRPTLDSQGRSDPDTGIRCSGPGKGTSFSAVNLAKEKALYIQIFSDNVSTPQGEISEPMAAVLKLFWTDLVSDLEISNIQECRAPDWEHCAL